MARNHSPGLEAGNVSAARQAPLDNPYSLSLVFIPHLPNESNRYDTLKHHGQSGGGQSREVRNPIVFQLPFSELRSVAEKTKVKGHRRVPERIEGGGTSHCSLTFSPCRTLGFRSRNRRNSSVSDASFQPLLGYVLYIRLLFDYKLI